MNEERQRIIDSTYHALSIDNEDIDKHKMINKIWTILFGIVDKQYEEGGKNKLDPLEIIDNCRLFKSDKIKPGLRDFFVNKLSSYLYDYKPIKVHRIKINKDWLENI